LINLCIQQLGQKYFKYPSIKPPQGKSDQEQIPIAKRKAHRPIHFPSLLYRKLSIPR